MQRIFQVDRFFVVRAYSRSHRRLLLRSEREAGYSTRIDIMFEHVERMSVAASYKSLEIFVADEGYSRKLSAKLGQEVESRYLFLLGESGADYVISGVPAWHEDDKRGTEASYFGSFPGA